MTVELETQLREYASHVTELSTAVDVDGLLTEPPEAVPLPAPHLQPRRGVALAAAAILVVLIGGLALGYRFLVSDVEPVITQPSSTIVTPTTTPVPETTLTSPTTTVLAPSTTLAVALPMTWEPVPPQAALGDSDDQREYMMNTVISGEGRLIAAGSIYSSDESSEGDTAAIWTSENGVDWELLPIDGSGLDVDAAIYDLAVGDFGYIAVGEAFDDPVVRDFGLKVGRPAVWVSSDLVSWTQVQSKAFQEFALMEGVAAGKKGIVAVGGLGVGSEMGSVWLSPDGWTWQRVLDEEIPTFTDVAATDWGFVIAGWREESVSTHVGARIGHEAPSLFVSEDGLEWEQIELPEDGSWFGAHAQSIHAVGEDILVAGYYRSYDHWYYGMHPVFWASSDLVNWDLRYLPPVNVPEFRDESVNLRDLVKTDRGLVAVGGWIQYPVEVNNNHFPGKAMPAVWAAPGDQDWAEVTPRVFGIETLEEDGELAGPPAIGGQEEHGDGMFEEVVAFEGKLVAVMTQQGRATVWIGEWTD